MSDIKFNKPLVTGSTGFLGGRLIELLILKYNLKPKVILRDYSTAARLSRFDIDMIKASLTDIDDVSEIIKNCDMVFHCAYDFSSRKNNIDAINTLAQACIKYSIKLIHISTTSVYEPYVDGTLNESTIPIGKSTSYSITKKEIENTITKLVKYSGLNAVILQPAIIYGPFCRVWTDRQINQLLTGKVILPNKGQGFCNAVYVDDVCYAMICAANTENIQGEKYIISSEEPISWYDFFNFFQQILGVDSISFLSYEKINNMTKNPISLFKMILSDPKRAVDWEPMRSFLLSLRYRLSPSIKSNLKQLMNYYNKKNINKEFFPNKQLLNLYSAKCIMSIDKAKLELGYSPKYSLAKTEKIIEQYISWLKLID